MSVDWQLIAVFLAVATAASYIVRRLRHAMRLHRQPAAGGACGSCGSCDANANDTGKATTGFVSLESLVAKRPHS